MCMISLHLHSPMHLADEETEARSHQATHTETVRGGEAVNDRHLLVKGLFFFSPAPHHIFLFYRLSNLSLTVSWHFILQVKSTQEQHAMVINEPGKGHLIQTPTHHTTHLWSLTIY